MDDLQIGLVGVGAALVVGIIGFNKWQEYRHRKQADAVFPEHARDALLEPGAAAAEERVEPAVSAVEPQERVEPVIASTEPSEPAEPAPAPRHDQPLGRAKPALPAGIDPATDCAVLIEAFEALPADVLWKVAREELLKLSKRVSWYALSDHGNEWLELPLREPSADRHHWFCAAMQLVDRNGPLGDSEFGRFIDSAQHVAESLMAVPASVPTKAEVLGRAAELDRICAEVDVQIGINIISQNQPFSGTKLRGLAEASGLLLRDDGQFHFVDEEGNDLFVLCNLEPTVLAPDTLRTLQTRGLTLVVEVPRVASPSVLDRMMTVARQLAEALGGVVVDDNRAPLGPQSLSVIREQISRYHQRMRDQGIQPGSALARRLFA